MALAAGYRPAREPEAEEERLPEWRRRLTARDNTGSITHDAQGRRIGAFGMPLVKPLDKEREPGA